ncbi:MAG: CPBP family intramembrane glutamic endopeptidase [Solirubrobacteraceae bacterium]
MGSAVFELILFSLPSLLYARRLRRSGANRLEVRTVVGLQSGSRADYLLAVVIAPLGIALALLLLNLIPTHVLHGGSKNIVGAPDTAGGYAAIVLLALAEEMLFRGFLAGLLFRRFGFGTGNAIQATLFLAPHMLLLLVSASLWPILPLQFIAGWVLGWLRQRSDSIGPPWLLHSLTNLAAALLLAV